MRMGNRIFVDPDSDPEQDLFRMNSNGVGHPGLLLLMYPRPVMVASAVLDFFPIEGTRKSFREAQRLYERFGNVNRIAMTEGYHPHQYSDENQEAALDFLDRFNGMPIRHGLAQPKLLPDKDLVCTQSGQVMVDQSDFRSLAEVIREYYEERKSQPAVGLSTEYYEFRAMHVENSKLEMFNGVPPGEDQILWELVSSSNSGDVQIDKYILRHSRMLEMPLLFFHKASNAPQKIVLWFGETGKATRADWPELQKFLQSGYNVVTFDFRGLGETRMMYTAVSPDDPSLGKLDFDRAYANSLSGVLANYVYNSLLTGHPYFFQMIEDSQIASRFATEKLGAKSIAVTAPGDAYTFASAIAEVFPEIKLLPQQNVTALKWSEIVERKQETWPIQYLVPGGAYIH
jgi:hypothetical protein